MGHPLEKFKFCPVCGSSHFEVNNFKSKKCQDCGFTYYANPCSATAAFIVNDKQEMLVVRRAKEPAKGTLDLPGGFVDMGETVEQGMRREIMEETGLDTRKSNTSFLRLTSICIAAWVSTHSIWTFWFLCTAMSQSSKLPTMLPRRFGFPSAKSILLSLV